MLGRMSGALDPDDAATDASRWIGIFAPLNIAAYVTWAAVALGAVRSQMQHPASIRIWMGGVSLIAMLALFIWHVARDREEHVTAVRVNLLLQGALIVLADYLLSGSQAVVLLIIVAAQAAWVWPAALAAVILAFFNGLILWRWTASSGAFGQATLQLIPLLAFQAFAALTAYYAGMVELARAGLARINAGLLATRQLLQESARTDERLKLSRELHDVSGHKLTALKLQLTRLARDPALSGHPQIAACGQLADELLADLRGVVGALRQHDGLELATALRALAQPLAGTSIDVDVPGDLRVESVARADALLRAAQEAITNALRHGGARNVRLNCRRTDGGVLLEVTNDGARPPQLVFGNGLTGMRERLLAVGGHMTIDTDGPAQGVRLRVWLPEDRS